MTCSQAGLRSALRWTLVWNFAAAYMAASLAFVSPGHAQEPIKIGFSVALTGGLASSGKAHLLSKQIWTEEMPIRVVRVRHWLQPSRRTLEVGVQFGRHR